MNSTGVLNWHVACGMPPAGRGGYAHIPLPQSPLLPTEHLLPATGQGAGNNNKNWTPVVGGRVRGAFYRAPLAEKRQTFGK
jgi:hypothetical protein